MQCAIWYYFYDLKNVKNTDGGVLLLVCNFTKSKTPPRLFFTFWNCTNGTKSRNASHLWIKRCSTGLLISQNRNDTEMRQKEYTESINPVQVAKKWDSDYQLTK